MKECHYECILKLDNFCTLVYIANRSENIMIISVKFMVLCPHLFLHSQANTETPPPPIAIAIRSLVVFCGWHHKKRGVVGIQIHSEEFNQIMLIFL